MKFAFVAGALLLVRTIHAFSISEDFNGTQLDPNNWTEYLGFGTSSITETNGYLRVHNGGELISRKPFNAPFEVQGELRFSGGASDNFTLVFRSNGQRRIDSIEPTNGIAIHIEPTTDGASSSNIVSAVREADGYSYGSALVPSLEGRFFPFRLSDMGTNFSFYLGDTTTPILSAKETLLGGDRVILFNHLGLGGAQFDLDSIRIGNPPAPDLQIYTAVELAFQSTLGATYQLQVSSDGTNWTNINEQITGDGGMIYRLFSTRQNSKLLYRAQEVLPADQQLIEQAENLPAIIDCIARPQFAGLKIGASVASIGACPDGGEQKEVNIFGGPNCAPDQPCPLFIVSIAKVTFDCSGKIISVQCQ